MDQFRSDDLGDVFGVLESEEGNLLDFDALEFALTAPEDIVGISQAPDLGADVINLGVHVMAFNKSSNGSTDSVGHSGESHHHPALMAFDWKSLVKPQPPEEDFQGETTAMGGTNTNAGGAKKKRTRNQEQMHMNRVAQQRYRERKKTEQNELKVAVDQLAAQLAAFKALEVRASQLEADNEGLQTTVKEQAQQISSQQTVITQQQAQLNEAAAISLGQQKMILEQHKKLQLQEQIIIQLKDRLKSSVETALTNLNEGSVCEQVLGAVKAALYGAKDVEGLQDVLERLPDALVVEICKNIMATCKQLWPELHQQAHARCAAYHATVGPMVPH